MNKGLFSVSVAGEALAVGTMETVLQIISASGTKARSFEVVRWGVSFNGTSASDAPVQVDLYRPTSDGTSSDYVPRALNPSSDPCGATAKTAHTAEPTPGDVLETFYVTPYGGLLVMQYAPDERPIAGPNQIRLGIRCQAAAAVNVRAFMVFAE
jgi:hypothetical protein